MISHSIESINEHVGKTIGTTDWFTIDQDRINAFADATLDHQWIHVDKEKAAASILGSTIAHGYLTLSLLPYFNSQIRLFKEGEVQNVLNYGADKLRFLTPVKVDSKVRCHIKLISVKQKPNGLLIKMENTVEIEGMPKPAMVAETLSLILPF